MNSPWTRLRHYCVVPSAKLLTVLLLGAALATPGTAGECGWLAPSELDRHFPQFAPWRVEVGGVVGSCQFLSRRDEAPNVFSANQMVMETDEAAAEMAQNLRQESAKTQVVMPRAELGEHGYTYLSESAGEARTINLVGHRGRVVVIGLVSLQTEITDVELAAILELAQAALSVADQPDVLTTASDCPWFETARLPQLLPGGAVKQQTFGENSCMAQDDSQAVLLVSASPAIPAMMERRDGGCTWEELPQLGTGAVLGYSCREGNPRATLRLAVEGTMIEYNLTPGTEPTTTQRAQLVEMARAIRDRLAN